MQTLSDDVLRLAAARATYVIDPAQCLRHVSITDRDVGRAPAEILRVLQALRTGDLCPVDWHPGDQTLTQTPALAS